MLGLTQNIHGIVLRHFNDVPSAVPMSLTFTLIAINLER